MSFSYVGDSMEEIHRALMAQLINSPDYEVAPRGMKIRELLFPSFTLNDPRNRLITSPAREVNWGFAVGELCWYVRGDDDLETMLYYNKRAAQFSDDGATLNSAYGKRLFDDEYLDSWTQRTYTSQWEMVLKELKADPDSRRAVMHINQPKDLLKATTKGSKDVPCTLSMQLFIRNKRLHMHVIMRSNDLAWGTPYDVFSFTCMQEIFLRLLQAEGVAVDDLGSYHHTAGSLHLYERHYEMARSIEGETLETDPMKPFGVDELEHLAYELEPQIRGSKDDLTIGSGYREARLAETSVEWMARQLVAHRDKRYRQSQEKKTK